MSKQRTRMLGPELFRIIAALFVFLMHSLSRLGTYYGPLQALISTGGVYMTGFFMLSGFMSALSAADRDFSSAGEVKRFLRRRLVSLMPLYLFLAIVHVIETYGTKRFMRELFLIPVEFTGT
ncbi:MAG: acyltransferase family protein, partial [Solobacterium sp.]|nr:acyltransferase family protein [Solobacterium sp.]